MSDDWMQARGGTYTMRRGSPPSMEFFRDERPPAGASAFGLTLDALRFEAEGLDDALAGALVHRYAPYADTGAPGPGALRVRVGREDREYFIEPPERLEFNPVWLGFEGQRVRYTGYRLAGWFDLAAGDGRLLLARGTYEPELRAVENYVRVAVAWMAASRGGALVHAASAVWRDKAYLFYGESGAGKSTLSAVNRRATIVSDDLTLVLPREGGGLDVVGSPFRGTWEGGKPVRGRFPLAAGFRLVKADVAEVRSVPRILAFGQLVGNLTFVAEAFEARPDLFASVERAFAGIPLQHLHFRKDDSYWDAIEAAGL